MSPGTDADSVGEEVGDEDRVESGGEGGDWGMVSEVGTTIGVRVSPFALF
jgi:hypothetical protein